MTTTFDFGGDKEKMLKAAKDPKTSPEILDVLVKNQSVTIRTAAINNPSIRTSTLEDIAEKTNSENTISAILTNKNASGASLVILLNKTGYYKKSLCLTISEHPRANAYILNLLAEHFIHKALDILHNIAKHPKTAPITLTLLASRLLTKSSHNMLISVARHLNTPVDTLDFLAKNNDDIAIYHAISCNRNAPEHTLNYIKQKQLEAEINRQEEFQHSSEIHNDNFDDSECEFLGLQNLDFLPSLEIVNYGKNQEIVRFLSIYDEGFEHWFENLVNDSLELFKQGRLPSWWNFRGMFVLNENGNLNVILEIIENRDTPTSTLEAILEMATAKNIVEPIRSKIKHAVDIALERKHIEIQHLIKIHDAPVSAAITKNESYLQPTGFKIPPPPEPLEFNTDRIFEIKTESKKVSAMLNAIYDQDETTTVAEKAVPQSTQSVLNLDETHLEIVKILATKPEWGRNELQKMMKGMMIDGVLEHINEAFFDYCDEAFIEGDDPIEINIELYKEVFK